MPIDALVEYGPDNGETVVYFSRNKLPYCSDNAEPYTIQEQGADIAFDVGYPVRPLSVRITGELTDQGHAALRELFGAPLAEAVSAAPSIGFCALRFKLSPEQTHNLAELQFADEATPGTLRELCSYIAEDTAAWERRNPLSSGDIKPHDMPNAA